MTSKDVIMCASAIYWLFSTEQTGKKSIIFNWTNEEEENPLTLSYNVDERSPHVTAVSKSSTILLMWYDFNYSIPSKKDDFHFDAIPKLQRFNIGMEGGGGGGVISAYPVWWM